jgi:hypothetical protein
VTVDQFHANQSSFITASGDAVPSIIVLKGKNWVAKNGKNFATPSEFAKCVLTKNE